MGEENKEGEKGERGRKTKWQREEMREEKEGREGGRGVGATCPMPKLLLSTNPSSKNESCKLPPGFFSNWM